MPHDFLVVTEIDLWYLSTRLPHDMNFIWRFALCLGISSYRIEKIMTEQKQYFAPWDVNSKDFRQFVLFKLMIFRFQQITPEEFANNLARLLETDGNLILLDNMPSAKRYFSSFSFFILFIIFQSALSYFSYSHFPLAE